MADISVTAASVRLASNGPDLRVQWGETVAHGELVYRSATDSKYYLADSNAAGKQAADGIALTPGVADSWGFIALPGSTVKLGTASTTNGLAYYASNTAGKIAERADLAAGSTLIFVGSGSGTDAIVFKPSNTGVVI